MVNVMHFQHKPCNSLYIQANLVIPGEANMVNVMNFHHYHG